MPTTEMKQRTRWRPTGAVAIMDKDRLGTAYLYSYQSLPAVICYRGRKVRPDVHVRRSTQAEVESTVRRWLDGLRQAAETRKRHRAARDLDEWSRNNVIRRIKAGLGRRGLRYSVTGGRGTAWGWIQIDLLPSVEKLLTPERRRDAYRELNQALGLNPRCFTLGSVGVPASTDYYREYVDRAEGRTPAKLGEPYWD